MLNESQKKQARQRAERMLAEAGIIISDKELRSLEFADVGLGRFDEIGLTILVYVNTSRICAKELVVSPWQICPEHIHPPVAGEPGKEETFRCRWGEVYLYVPGKPAVEPKARVPEDKRDTFTVWHEVILRPGDQYTL
ncbi:MAG: D-lyxose/D-mannose family sugar isomerase, partial [Gemmatimonadota bacterium]|nr:D-lyxose/D-mannose family sugar isomerase [Gemmatimonadota bacterium]